MTIIPGQILFGILLRRHRKPQASTLATPQPCWCALTDPGRRKVGIDCGGPGHLHTLPCPSFPPPPPHYLVSPAQSPAPTPSTLVRRAQKAVEKPQESFKQSNQAARQPTRLGLASHPLSPSTRRRDTGRASHLFFVRAVSPALGCSRSPCSTFCPPPVATEGTPESEQERICASRERFQHAISG